MDAAAVVDAILVPKVALNRPKTKPESPSTINVLRGLLFRLYINFLITICLLLFQLLNHAMSNVPFFLGSLAYSAMIHHFQQKDPTFDTFWVHVAKISIMLLGFASLYSRIPLYYSVILFSFATIRVWILKDFDSHDQLDNFFEMRWK